MRFRIVLHFKPSLSAASAIALHSSFTTDSLCRIQPDIQLRITHTQSLTQPVMSSPPASASVAVVSSKKKVELGFIENFMAGTLGGIFGLTLCYPLDTVKVRIQTRPQGTYTGIINCMKVLVTSEGPASLYRGLLSPVLGYGLIKATAFASYDQAKKFTTASHQTNTQPLSLFELTLCGGFAGFCQTFVRSPIEQIKVVMQSRVKPGSTVAPYKGTFDCLKHVLKTEGVKNGLYRSFWPTLSREIPQYAIYYPSYEIMVKLQCEPGQTVSDLKPIQVAFAGGIAGVAQWVPTYSLDVIKSKVSAAPPGTYKGILDCAVRSYRADGIAVFWRGISAAVVRAFPLHGAVFLGYELSIKFLEKSKA